MNSFATKSFATSHPAAVLAATLLGFGAVGACGGDGSAETRGGSGAAASESAPPAPDHATVIIGDRTWTFSEYSCVILSSAEYVSGDPYPSDDGTVRLSVAHEADDRSAVTVSAEDDSFQYSMGEAGPPPAVTIDGRTATFEGTFMDDFGSGEEADGSATLQC